MTKIFKPMSKQQYATVARHCPVERSVPSHCEGHWAINNPSATAFDSKTQAVIFEKEQHCSVGLPLFYIWHLVTLQNGKRTRKQLCHFGLHQTTTHPVCVAFLTWRLANVAPSGRILRFDVDSAQLMCCCCSAAVVLLLRHSHHLPRELGTWDLTAATGSLLRESRPAQNQHNLLSRWSLCLSLFLFCSCYQMKPKCLHCFLVH